MSWYMVVMRWLMAGRSGDGDFGGDDAGEEENVRGERLDDQSGSVLWVCE